MKLVVVPGTGYSWQVRSLDAAQLETLGRGPDQPIGEAKPGASVLQVLRFRAIADGVSTLELGYLRPFEKDRPPLRSVFLHVRVSKSSNGEAPNSPPERKP